MVIQLEKLLITDTLINNITKIIKVFYSYIY
jgi:hypothetical protein